MQKSRTVIICVIVTVSALIYTYFNVVYHVKTELTENKILIQPLDDDNVENVHTIQTQLIQNKIKPIDGNDNKVVYLHSSFPYEYPEEVDLRLIVITFKRHKSLQVLLESLSKLETYQGDSLALEIWIDRDKSGSVDDETLMTATNYVWTKGIKRVHVQDHPTGLFGQWVYTWKPKPQTNELALFLEDDLTISPYTWYWLKAVNQKYGQDENCYGYTLQSENLINGTGGGFHRPSKDAVFMYELIGSWGFAAKPNHWRQFQSWTSTVRNNKAFHPYIPNTIFTKWYKSFEKNKSENSMWTIWLIYYAHMKQQYCIYNNIAKLTNTKNVQLSINRKEPGLHYHGKPKTIQVDKLLLAKWSNNFIYFPDKPIKYGIYGNRT